MSLERRRQVFGALVAVIAGVVAVVVVTSLVTVAIASSNAERSTALLQAEVEALRDQQTAEREATLKRSAAAAKDRERLTKQNERLRRQIDALLTFLQENGLNPPRTAGDSAGSSVDQGDVEVAQSPSASARKPVAPRRPADRPTPAATATPPSPAPAPSSPTPTPAPPRPCLLFICLP